jgi:hypothetical protein
MATTSSSAGDTPTLVERRHFARDVAVFSFVDVAELRRRSQVV